LRPRSRNPRRRGHRTRTTIAAATAIASLAVTAGASAGGGDSGGTGGSGAIDPPKVSDVRCIELCADVREAAEGSKVEFTGKHLGGVDEVRFTGAEGRIVVDPRRVRGRSVKTVVPPAAQTGFPTLAGSDGKATSPAKLTIVPVDQIPRGGEFALRSAKADPTKAYYDGEKAAKVRYQFCCETTDVRVEVVKKKTGKVVASWREREQQPNTENTSRWNGKTDSGRSPKRGKFKFKVGPVSGGLQGTEDTDFGYYGYKFPVRGRHSYGDGIGAGRGHQGQDVFAKCGTPLEAARGGRVQTRQYHSAAGYYLVIDGKATGRDFAYMHMLRKGRAKDGERVHTGERIGFVGETGNASGCHLHFEIWSAPGWYQGGHFTNPTDDLREWDKYS
jgi:murein DD-endopeptidase MepM/ murein hydrolase activator NlpD